MMREFRAIIGDDGIVDRKIVVSAGYDGVGIPCPAEVNRGWSWSEGAGFAPPPAPPDERAVGDARIDALRALRDAHARASRAATGEPSLEEVAAWPAKQAAVEAYRRGDLDAPSTRIAGAKLALLEAEATRDGISLAELVAKIEAKVVAFHVLVGDLDGARDAAIGAIDAAATPAEVDQAAADGRSALSRIVELAAP